MEQKNIQLRRLGRQIKLAGFQVVILGLLLSVQLRCSAEENERFNVFLKKFNLIEFPIDLASLDRDKKISTDEFDLFMNLDSTKWQNKDEFYYFTISRFNLNEFVGLFFQRVYESDVSHDYEIENILCILDEMGNIKSSLIVGGSYLVGDNETNISGDFKSDLTLKIERNDFFSEGNEKSDTSYYKIDSNSGQILKIK